MAANRRIRCRCGKPSHVAHRRQHPLGHPSVTTSIRNGSKSRDTVPLWYAYFDTPGPTDDVGGIPIHAPHHNGSKSQDPVPLWHA